MGTENIVHLNNGITKFAGKWRKLENIILSEVKLAFLSQPLSRNSCVSHSSLHLGWSAQTKVKLLVLLDLQIAELSRQPASSPSS